MKRPKISTLLKHNKAEKPASISKHVKSAIGRFGVVLKELGYSVADRLNIFGKAGYDVSRDTERRWRNEVIKRAKVEQEVEHRGGLNAILTEVEEKLVVGMVIECYNMDDAAGIKDIEKWIEWAFNKKVGGAIISRLMKKFFLRMKFSRKRTAGYGLNRKQLAKTFLEEVLRLRDHFRVPNGMQKSIVIDGTTTKHSGEKKRGYCPRGV